MTLFLAGCSSMRVACGSRLLFFVAILGFIGVRC